MRTRRRRSSGQAGEAAEIARNDLLLAKELPLDALLTAFVDPDRQAARPQLVDVLARVAMQSEDPRILPALRQRLRDDSDAKVRAQVIYQIGTRDGAEILPDLFPALQDVDGDVLLQAVLALSQLRQQLSPAQDDPCACEPGSWPRIPTRKPIFAHCIWSEST